MKGPRASLATPEAVMNAHGGELTFWLAWLSDELKPELCDWFREQARQDPGLRKNLESIDQQSAREQFRSALEATNCLTPRWGPRSGEEEPLTNFAVSDTGAEAPPTRSLPPDRPETTRGEGPALFDWQAAAPRRRMKA